jgi:hypothetical protein
MENLETIGSKIIKLTIYNSKCDKNLLFDVLRLANCMQELIISYVWFNYQANKNSQDQIDFPLLKTLKLDNITNLKFIQEAFSKVDSLEHLQFKAAWNWNIYQSIVFRQTNLRSLELGEGKIDSFEWKELNRCKSCH